MSVRDVTEERNLYLQSRDNGMKIRKANQEIKQYEEQLHYLLENSKMHVWHTTFKEGSIEFMSDLHNTVAKMTIEEFANTLQTDEKDIAIKRLTQPMDEKEESIVISRPFKNMLEKDDKVHWYNLLKIPEYDENKVQTGYFGLIRDVTLLMEEQEMLRRETERANDSDRMKSVFLANMTHEIRTPLNAIVGFSDLLQAIDSPDEKLEMMRIIRNNCDMLLRLINDFLAISAIESNGLSMNIKEIDFAKEFNDFYTGLTQRVGETSVEFICDNPYASLITKLDIERIGQVITNFVTNAVKYTQQGHITIGYHTEPDGLYIYCEDTGTGIAKEDCERIFERFVKLNDYIQGTGLGLSICKAIVERCNGTIGVESELGKGSTFWFRIPCEILGKVKK
jgi:signal transduction histidine kinase